MMSGWPCAGKNSLGFTGKNKVNRLFHCPRSQSRGGKRAWGQMRVGIDHNEPGCGSAGRDFLQIERFVDSLQCLGRYGTGFEMLETGPLAGFLEVGQNRLCAFGSFGMTIVHSVLIVGGVA